MVISLAGLLITLAVGCIECQELKVSRDTSGWQDSPCSRGLATPSEVTGNFKSRLNQLRIASNRSYWVGGRKVSTDCDECCVTTSKTPQFVCSLTSDEDGCDDCKLFEGTDWAQWKSHCLETKGVIVRCSSGQGNRQAYAGSSWIQYRNNLWMWLKGDDLQGDAPHTRSEGNCLAVQRSTSNIRVQFVAVECDSVLNSICITDPFTRSPDDQLQKEEDGDSTVTSAENSAIVIGLSITVVLVVLAATVIIAVLCYRRRKQQQHPAQVTKTEVGDYTYINDAHIVGSTSTKAGLHQVDNEYSTLDHTANGTSSDHPYLRVKSDVHDQSDEYNKLGQNDEKAKNCHGSTDYDHIQSDHATTADYFVLEDQRADSNDADYNRLGQGEKPKKDTSNYDHINGMVDTREGTNEHFVLEGEHRDSVDDYNRLGEKDNKGKQISNYDHIASIPDGRDFDNPSNDGVPNRFVSKDKENTMSDDYNRLGEADNKGTELPNYNHTARVLDGKDADKPSEEDESNTVSDDYNRLGEGGSKYLPPSNYDHIASVGKDSDNSHEVATYDYFVLENERNTAPDDSTKLASADTVTAL